MKGAALRVLALDASYFSLFGGFIAKFIKVYSRFTRDGILPFVLHNCIHEAGLLTLRKIENKNQKSRFQQLIRCTQPHHFRRFSLICRHRQCSCLRFALRLTRQGASVAVAHRTFLPAVTRLAHQHVVRRNAAGHGVDRFVAARAPEANLVPLQPAWALHALRVVHDVATPGTRVATTRRMVATLRFG